MKKAPRRHGTKKLRVATHIDGLPRPLVSRCMGRSPRLSPSAPEVDTHIPRTDSHQPSALFGASHTIAPIIATDSIIHFLSKCKCFFVFLAAFLKKR